MMRKSMNFRLIQRSHLLLAILIGLTMLFIYWFIDSSGMIYGVTPEVDEERALVRKEAHLATVIEGRIEDRNGEVICEGLEPGEPAVSCQPLAYGYLTGYNSKIYQRSGLRARYSQYLFDTTKDNRGATIRLTTDSQLQQDAYQLLGDNAGSIIILDNANGSVLALASRGEIKFNVNSIDEDWTEISAIDGMLLSNGIDDWTDPPGSTFKVVTASAALEAGYSDEQLTYYDDGVFYADGFAIHNAGGGINGQIGLEQAIIRSCNTYFANLAVGLGGYALQSQAEQFLIGTEIMLDFTTLHSEFNLGDYSTAALAQNGFGQGMTCISPLHLGMIYQSIANGGHMLRPFLIDSIYLGKKTIAKGQGKEKLAQPVSLQTAQTLQGFLHQAAISYGFDEANYGYICAKTGTAELANGLNHIYFCGFTDDYTFVISRNNTSNSSRSLLTTADSLIKQLNAYALHKSDIRNLL